MTRWEYRVWAFERKNSYHSEDHPERSLDKEYAIGLSGINTLGKEGWEVVSVFHKTGDSEDYSYEFHALLKRPIQEIY
ncbi:MAG: DUF4177 domain-containing protein [Nitrospirae bacterium]|nr:DUF4177 domain-containing protein [Nitrospirota bacterium]